MEHKKALFCIFAIIHLFFWIIFSSLNHFKLDTFLSYEIAFFSVLLIIFTSYLNYKKVIIKKSKNYEKDFSYKISRHFDYYENLLLWCKIFLKNESFMPYHGKNEAFALLFPMEKIFEDYVAYMLKKVNPAQDIKVQNNGKYLISKNDENCFMLKPDLYIENKMILDTKWKIPNDSEDEKKQGIEQSDLYQMFAYACKFKIYDIKLVYPLCEKTQDLQRKIAEKFFVFKASEHLYFKEQGQKDIKVQVCFAPLPF
ncbi:restriction endonuclease [Campylobacter jejuni]|nr:restriction endonuclease [Campylobacter jejuni]EAO7233625.1 restriction endonuclease [Campylobacter jejuni]ECL2334164.1 restriction endonuclease [Campylobacter jejuni]